MWGGYVYVSVSGYLQRQEENVRSNGSGLTGGGEPPDTDVLWDELLPL